MNEKTINVHVCCPQCHGEYTTLLPIPNDRPPELDGEQPCPEQWDRFFHLIEQRQMLDRLVTTESADVSICPNCGTFTDPWDELSRQYRDFKDSDKPK